MATNSEKFNFVIDNSNQTQVTHPGDSTITTYTSDKVKGDGYYGRSDGLHSVQYNLNGVIGKLSIQASLATTPLTDDWFTVTTVTHDNSSGTTSNGLATGSFIHNFTGNYVWIRAIISDFTDGTINSILINH